MILIWTPFPRGGGGVLPFFVGWLWSTLTLIQGRLTTTTTPLSSSSSSSSSSPLLTTTLLNTTTTTTSTKEPTNKTLQTSMCQDTSCSNHCQIYETPFTTCYNGHMLFPHDPSWSVWDIRDEELQEPPQHEQQHHHPPNNSTTPLASPRQLPQSQQFQRSFYATHDSSCQGEPTDVYILPLEECVGPFGKPRPWGTFSVVVVLKEHENKNDETRHTNTPSEKVITTRSLQG